MKNKIKTTVIKIIGFFILNTITSYPFDILTLRQAYLQGKITDYTYIENLETTPQETIIKYLILFEYYTDKKNYEKAEEYATILSSYYPINQLTNYRLGELLYNQKVYEESLSYFYTCTQNDSRFHEARRHLAKACYILKEYKDAYKHYNVLSWFCPDEEVLTKVDYLSNHIEDEFIQKEKKFTEASSNIENSLVDKIPQIKVGISTKDNGKLMKIDCIKFHSSSDFVIYDENGKEVFKGRAGLETEWTIVYRTSIKKFCIILPYLNKELRIKSNFLEISNINNNQTFLITEYKWFKNKYPQNLEYRGNLIIKHLKDQIIVINKLPIEEYLYSVVPKEIGKNVPYEAAKVQSVTARTLALYRKKLKIHKHFDICRGQHCQVYGGIRSENEQINTAVNETLGEVILNNEKLVHTFFHANCGGITISEQNFYGNTTLIYDTIEQNINIDNWFYWYLLPQRLLCSPSEYVHPGTSRWLRISNKETLSDYLNKKYNIGKLKEIKIEERKKNGYIKKMKIIGTKRNKTLTLEHEIRNIVPNGSLRSSSFIVEYNKNNSTYYFWGAGWGHGIGMCQSGTVNLAKENKNYIEIIKHYYPSVEIKKVYDIY